MGSLSKEGTVKSYVKPVLQRRDALAMATALKTISQKLSKSPPP